MKFVIRVLGHDWQTTFLFDSEEMTKAVVEGCGPDAIPIAEIQLPFRRQDKINVENGR